MKRTTAALLPLLWLALTAQAEVQEHLREQYYDLQVASGQSLSRALNQASPIRQNGQIYHAYTRWQVQWKFWWREQRDGRCQIDLTRTQLNATITLPRLGGGDAQQRQRFEQYLGALREHELGHYRIGQAAAAEIDAALLQTPEYPSCAELQQQANRRANAILQRHTEQERQYDQQTGHGRSQGAWLTE
jgi:predicted secreted Zn-dependent protease